MWKIVLPSSDTAKARPRANSRVGEGHDERGHPGSGDEQRR